jgi:phosphoribosylamine--glycine ligase
MNAVIIGSGGREHAIAWRLAQSPLIDSLYALPGNPGIAEAAECVNIGVMDFERIEAFVRDQKIALAVIGPEDPLAGGLADRLEAAGVKVFGPSAAAARLEADKWFAKELMRHQSVPTAEARSFTSLVAAEEYVRTRGAPCVVKATGLAKGKGVTVCYRTQDAIDAIQQAMKHKVFGSAGDRVVVEELLVGPECSLLAFVDGQTIYLMEPAQDHKPVDDGDTGPMTGGMGAYTPTPVLGEQVLEQVQRDVFVPILDGLKREGITYRGVLYAGMMLTTAGPKVLEFNVRFGDPETQPLLMRLQTDLAEVMLATAEGRLDEIELKWDPRPAVCVVAVSGGYPGKYQSGMPITGIPEAEKLGDVKVFHSGTARRGETLVSDGGRVLGVTALGDTVADAQKRAYEAMALVRFEGMHYRRDIAHQAIRRG